MAKLLDAGAQVFATKGFHAARVDDIVKAAQTSHGTFYLYFPNKEALFRALAEDVAAQMEGLSESLGPVTPDEAGKSELRAWLARFSEVYERSGAVIGAWTAAETGDSEVGRIGTELLGGFAVMLSRRISGGTPDGVEPAVAAMALVAMIERYQYYALSGMVRADRDAVLDTLAGVTHAALFGAVAGAPVRAS
ncbi:MAG: TetR/AcrR family transcriptional regulator [Actinobacteria bacterium]|nr:TetR/AcrR family transcriptional regulator [Actinomycetota bacterium]